MYRSSMLMESFAKPLLRSSIVSLLVCLVATVALVGCGDSTAKRTQSIAAATGPKAEFDWGMERLERAMRDRPSSVGGLHVLGRELDHEFYPPSGDKTEYTAKVTITTKTSFLHAKRRSKTETPEEKSPENELKVEDPLAVKGDDPIDLSELQPEASKVAAVDIEPREIERVSVFNMVYQDGHWKLSEKPEFEYEQSLFDYAFN